MIMSKMADFDSQVSLDSYLFMKNKDSQSCFQIACIKG